MAASFKRLYVGAKVKTVGNVALYRFEDIVPSEGVIYYAYENYAECIGKNTGTGAVAIYDLVIAHAYKGKLVTHISADAFKNYTPLNSVVLPDTLKNIGKYAFNLCSNITSITFLGTTEQWKAVTKGTGWISGCTLVTCVHCSDGDSTVLS